MTPQRPRTRRIRRIHGALTLASAGTLLAACTGPESMLDTAGPAAAETANIWWFMFWLGGAVYVGVMIAMAVALRKGRARNRRLGQDLTDLDLTEVRDDTVTRRLVLYGGVVIPIAVLLLLNVVTAPLSMSVGDRGTAAPSEGDEVIIDVVAEKFWWRVEYPEHGLLTANEIHIPVDVPARIRLTSADVIHSFWIPKLAGKIDATPGHTTELVLQADEPGRYRGRCTEFCGLAHAQMVVWVVAQEPAEFDAWVEQQIQPQPHELEDERIEEGRQVFFGSSCVYCHNVDGHGPPNMIGPDLTHLASRETIAGGILANNRGNLGGWVVDPQSLKPGNLMPGTQIAGDELDALLDYLESLE